MPARRTRILVVLFVAIAIVAGCGRRRPSRSGPARQLKKSELSVAEQKYGIAPIPDPSVTYQPDVIVVGGGADAIRAQSSNGFIWTIDGNAPHAAELAEGKIIFLTNRAVGRVLQVHKDGGNLEVTVGPVAITEIIRKCDIRIDSMPIDFGEAIAYTTPDLPGRVIADQGSAEARPWGDSDAAVTPVAFMTQSGSAPGSQPASVPDVSSLVNFKVVPTASAAGIGLRATSDGGGLNVSAEALVHIKKPALDARLRITDDGDLREATLALSGAAGLTIKFEASTDVGRKANVGGRLQATPDFSIPIGGGPVPLALTVRQTIILRTGLGVRNSKVSAIGDYTFDGSFTIGYKDKKWGVAGPLGFTARHSLLSTTDGYSLGAEGLDFAHQMKVVFGLGVAGFATGPYFGLNTSTGVFRGSDMGMIKCSEATVSVSMSGGIGYLIPKPVTDAINFILGALHVKYRIAGSGGLQADPMTIINSTSTLPGCKAGHGA